MKLTTSSALAILAYSASVNGFQAVKASSENEHAVVLKRDASPLELSQLIPEDALKNINWEALLAELDDIKIKRDVLDVEISKREYKIVTDVLAAINQTQLAPLILHFFATDATFQPIVIDAVVFLLKSGIINFTALFNALDESNLVGNVIEDLIADCDLYVKLFNAAKDIIGNLAQIVKDKIANGIGSLVSKRQVIPYNHDLLDMNKRDIDFNNVVVNLMESLYNSGLATSVVKDILTDSSYIPFATNLLKALISNNALPIDQIIDALKDTDFAVDLFKQLLTIQNAITIAENAFAAFAGTCAASEAPGGSPTTVTSGTSSGPTSSPGTCKRRRKRSHY
ncbi:opaque-phase-specific protein OP4 precursor [Scheffersomyces amazonensis]|uniref:opaque-phase-specific protein OP4 precursor n=1 Tax=Scheffersomyces amazonensis TaxID=1078765 RepID=UPI00315CFFA4